MSKEFDAFINYVDKLDNDVREQALLLRWLLKHYSTHTTKDGFFVYVDSIGNEVNIENILKHYRNNYDIMENDAEQLAKEHITKHHLNHSYNTSKFSFIEGYNKAKENTYTEEQVREAYWIGVNRGHGHQKTLTDDEYIQSLKQNKQ